MKKVIFLTFAFLFLIPFVNAITIDYDSTSLNKTGGIGEYPVLAISQLKYEPYPVEPGERFSLWIKVKNIGSDPADNVYVSLVETKTFSIDTDNTRIIGELQPAQEALLKFENIKVADDIADGINEIEFLLSPGGGYSKNILSRKLDIEIRSVDPILNIYVETYPGILSQGSPAKLNLTLENADNSIIRDINIKLQLPDEIAPIGTSIEKKIDRLLPKQRASLIYDIIPLGDALSNAYKIPINLTYRDETGDTISKDEVIGLLIGGVIDFDLGIKETDIVRKNQKGEVTLGVSNVGPSDIKFLILEVLPSEKYEILSNPREYIGNLESDDFQTVEFNLYIKEDNPEIKVSLKYKDNFNQDKEEIIDVPLNTYSYNEARKYGLVESGNQLMYLFYIIIIIILFLTWGEWRKTKNIKESIKNAFERFFRGLIRIIKSFSWRNIKRLPRRIKNFFDSS